MGSGEGVCRPSEVGGGPFPSCGKAGAKGFGTCKSAQPYCITPNKMLQAFDKTGIFDFVYREIVIISVLK
jgi:hypothetical protein